MSSNAAHAGAYDADDWQLVRSARPYEGTKFQVDLIRAELSRRLGSSAPIRHFTVHPGMVASSIDAALVGSFMSQIKVIAFYLVRASLAVFFFSRLSLSWCFVCPVFPGSVVWFFAPQHLAMEWIRRCSIRLPCSARIYSGLSICCRDVRYSKRDGAEGWLAPIMSALCNGSQGPQHRCVGAI